MGADRKRVLVYDDNPEYGGHQVMAALALERLIREPGLEIHFWYHAENRKWRDRLARMDAFGMRAGVTATKTERLQVVRNLWQRAPQLRIRLQELNPDLVLFIQGDIEHASLALQEARRGGYRCASYIPMVHSCRLMQARLPRLRDFLSRRIFAMVEDWITISPTIAAQLRAKSPRSRVHVVENGIQLDTFTSAGDRDELRRQMGLPETGRFCAMIGRVEYNQKRQDLAVDCFSRFRDVFAGWHLLIVGSGPDEADLERRIRESPARDFMHRLEWLDEPQRVYQAIDCLLLPSRYEGVPLVMLEALAAGVPVIGSDRDGMRDFLPETWRFPPGDTEALARVFGDAAADGFSEMPEVRNRVLEHNGVEAFQRAFADSVRKILAPS